MSEEDLELLIAMDDPGEDTLEEDTFHQADNTVAHRPGQAPINDPTNELKSLLIMTPPSWMGEEIGDDVRFLGSWPS
jgi:hypothetical protein